MCEELSDQVKGEQWLSRILVLPGEAKKSPQERWQVIMAGILQPNYQLLGCFLKVDRKVAEYRKIAMDPVPVPGPGDFGSRAIFMRRPISCHEYHHGAETNVPIMAVHRAIRKSERDQAALGVATGMR